MDNNLLTIKEVADKYGVHPLTVLYKIKKKCFTRSAAEDACKFD